MRTLTLKEAAELLKTCTETVSECIRCEGLPAAKVGRAWVLVDEDVINWLRKQYNKEDKCESIPEVNAASCGSMSQSEDAALRAALAPRAGRRQKNGPPRLRTIPGVRGSSNRHPV